MESLPSLVFVTGFQRSGTTVITEALAAAMGGKPLTAGALASFLPELARMLDAVEGGASMCDRGVDRRPVTRSMAEEYCWYLRARDHGSLRLRRRATGELRRLIEAAKPVEGPLVMKNPWDTGNERLLLDLFPESHVVIIRRCLPAIEASLRAALLRGGKNTYLKSLTEGSRAVMVWLALLRVPGVRRVVAAASIWRLRWLTIRLVRRTPKLDFARTTLLSYDQIATEPLVGAQAASRLCDPVRLAAEFTKRHDKFGDRRPARMSPVASKLDRRWEQAWAVSSGSRPV
jgi:hypothetical protein